MSGGRPSDYSQELADEIAERMVSGESLRAICRDEKMPHVATVMRWVAQNEEFREHYAMSMEQRAELLADEIVAISDSDGDVNRDRLRVDARKWVASRLLPKKYGDRVTQQHEGPGGGPVQVQITGDDANLL